MAARMCAAGPLRTLIFFIRAITPTLPVRPPAGKYREAVQTNSANLTHPPVRQIGINIATGARLNPAPATGPTAADARLPLPARPAVTAGRIRRWKTAITTTATCGKIAGRIGVIQDVGNMAFIIRRMVIMKTGGGGIPIVMTTDAPSAAVLIAPPRQPVAMPT